MITGATRSRAAILCFGGWGLQTMLHVQPRLAAIQDQRRARGVEGPDLTQITQFAALLPDAHRAADGHIPLHLRKVREDVSLPPFYLENLLTQLEADQQQDIQENIWLVGRAHGMFNQANPNLSLAESEQHSRRLLAAADPVLQSLTGEPLKRITYANGAHSTPQGWVSRADVFAAGLQQGVDIARMLDAHLIAPIRQDNLVPGDPFVQTTLYVVAPLFEPLASALIWPTLAHLINRLGERYISQIVGIFAIGSYAGDSSRAIEDAVGLASIVELEALTGIYPDAAPVVTALVSDKGRAAGEGASLEKWVGMPLFDRIYLVDREKSNQALIDNPYELSVLVGNALEALVTTDGNIFVDEQLGIDLRNAQDRPYSILGAAGDYVPLDYIFQTVHQQEEKRLIREVILDAEDGPEPEEEVTLADAGITQAQITAGLIAQMPDLFLNVMPQSLEDLQVHPDFILPASIAAELRHLPPAAWADAFEERLRTVAGEFDRLVGMPALDHAWGLDGLYANGLPKKLDDKRLLPATAYAMRRTFIDLLAESPAGLRQAQRRLATWQAALERERQLVLTSDAPGQRYIASAQRQLKIRQWRSRYERGRLNEPSLVGTLLRSTLVVVAILLITAAYLLGFERPIDLAKDGGMLAGMVIGLFAGGIIAYRRRLGQIQQRRRERLALAQQELSAQLQEQVQQGLVRAYEHLAQMLREMGRALEDTTEALAQWSMAEDLPTAAPVEYANTHLRRSHLSPRLWDICRTYLQTKQDQEGRQGEERLRASWRSVGWRRKLERILLEKHDDKPLAEALQALLRQSVQATIAEFSAASTQSARDELVKLLAAECNLEHLLWRDEVEARHPLLVQIDGGNRRATTQNLIHRYLEAVASNAKPAANYDVADRMAAHGIPIDFAAVWGSPESDLTGSMLREFRSTLLPTDDPFRVNYVRTVHGLTLSDLDNIHRYFLELTLINEAALTQITLVHRQRQAIYGIGEPKPDAIEAESALLQ